MYGGPNIGQVIELSKDDPKYPSGFDIIAFYIAAVGACGEHSGVEFVTRDGAVYHSNYVNPETGITYDDLCAVFPTLKENRLAFQPPFDLKNPWKEVYLGMGNTLYVLREFLARFDEMSKKVLKELDPEQERKVGLYNIWDNAMLKVIGRI